MELLPLEVVDMIVRKLSAKDVAACCATSHSWRDIFNKDVIWWRFSKPETAVYLARAPCRVEPAFISPEVEGSDLDPVCQGRINYMRENHLFNNWRLGRFWNEQLRGAPITLDNHRYGKCFLFYQEDFLIVTEHKKVTLWDLRGDPVPYTKEPCCLLPRWNVNYTFLHDNRLILVQYLAVLVFQINLMQPTWQLDHVFFFDKHEPTDFKRATKDILVNKIQCALVGRYLISINTAFIFSIWDVVNCFKLKEEKLEQNYRLFDIKPSLTSLDDIIVILYIEDVPFKRVLVYSLINFTFYPCVYYTCIPEYCVLHGDKIVISMESLTDHWGISNYKTGQLIHRIDLSNFSDFGGFNVFDDKLIYLSDGDLNQINLSSGEIKQFLDTGDNVMGYQILGDKFICMHVLKQSGNLVWSDMEVWEICNTSKKLKLRIAYETDDLMKANITNSKLIIEQCLNLSIIIINLW